MHRCQHNNSITSAWSQDIPCHCLDWSSWKVLGRLRGNYILKGPQVVEALGRIFGRMLAKKARGSRTPKTALGNISHTRARRTGSSTEAIVGAPGPMAVLRRGQLGPLASSISIGLAAIFLTAPPSWVGGLCLD